MAHKVAYLTVDDAPSAVYRQKLDYLVRRNIPAVFFCLGTALEERPDLATEAVQKGFILGNHAYNHPKFSDLTIAQCREQIRRTDEIIERVYRTAGKTRPAKYFRFPYGDKGGLKYSEVLEPYEGEGALRKEALQNFLRELGYTQPGFERITYAYYRQAGLLDDVDWHWTYDVMDWAIFAEEHMYGIDSLEKVLARMEEDVPEGGRGLNDPGSEEIVLMHDHPQTAEMFEPIMERMLEKGVTFQAVI